MRLARGEPDFPGAVLALGCLGVATRLWMVIEPAFEVRQQVYVDSPTAQVVQQIDEILAAAYSVSVFSSFRDPGTVDTIWFKSRLDAPAIHAELDALVGGAPADADLNPVAGQDPRPRRHSAACPDRGTSDCRTSRAGSSPAPGTRSSPSS